MENRTGPRTVSRVETRGDLSTSRKVNKNRARLESMLSWEAEIFQFIMIMKFKWCHEGATHPTRREYVLFVNFGRQGNQSQLLLAWTHRSGVPLWGGEDGWLTTWHGAVTYSYESVGGAKGLRLSMCGRQLTCG